jgi:transaldolase
MADVSYLQWLVKETPTTWWHDSADPDELQQGLAHGATGVTTNPLLTARTLRGRPEIWSDARKGVAAELPAERKAEELMRGVVTRAAALLLPQYRATKGRLGYVCGQVNPGRAGDREVMLAMARRYHAWAPNIAVKLPATAAALDVLEDCVAEGITITATVSFTVPQVLAIAERHRQGAARARAAGKVPGHCFPVLMLGRLDDYLREVAQDRRAKVEESDIRQASLAVAKRAYRLFKERGYDCLLLPAALRGVYHMTELAGAEMIISTAPNMQAKLLQPGVPRECRIERPVAPDVIQRLQTLPEFVKAYEPDGMAPEDFITYGPTQRTLAQFADAGWLLIEGIKPG